MNHKKVIFYLATILSASVTVSGNGENPSGGTPNGQHGGGGGGGGGSGGGLTVVISYESLNKCSQAFFQSQLTSEVFEEFSKCNIDWKFLPCSTSKMVNGKLTCWEGDDECAVDRMYACATKLNESKMKLIGKFVLCMHKANNQLCSAQNCASQSGLDNWDAIEKCSKSSEADKDCQKYWGQINDDWQITGIPGVMTPPKYSDCDNADAKKDFKGFLCKKVQEKGISCPACGGSGGGGGGGGGGHHGGGTPPPNNGSPPPNNGSPPPNNGSPPPNNGSPPPPGHC